MSDCGPADKADTPDVRQSDSGKLVEENPSNRTELVEAVKAILVEAGIDPEEPQAQTILAEVQTAHTYRGPIPDPASLAQYDEAVPGLAREIIDAWHEQRRHRIGLEAEGARSSDQRIDRSQRNSMIVSVVGLVVAGVAGIWGTWEAAALIALVSVGGPNAATIIARFVKPSG